MKTYPVGAATYSKSPDRYADGAPQEASIVSGAWLYEEEPVTVDDSPIRWNPGRKWVDLTSGMGAVLLGHGHHSVTKAIAAQLNHGISFPLPNPLEEQVAKRLLSMLTWERAESVRFGKNGADVTTSAVRLARAVTHHDLILYVDYHGHHDWCMRDPPWNAGVLSPDSPWASYHVDRNVHDHDSDTESTHREPVIDAILSISGIAGIVIEGSSSVVAGHEYCDDFWMDIRSACDKTGALLILDEMVTGFRMAPGGAAEALGIEPDLVCYGKAMANGMPLSAIVGPWEYMKRYEEDVFFSLTHGGEALSLAAANETLRIVAEENVPDQIATLGREIIQLFEDCGQGERLKYGYPQRLVFDFDKAELGVMLEKGVLCAGYANLTFAHVQDERARATIMDAFSAVLLANSGAAR